MNAVEKLEAAIDKLETLKFDSARGPWSARRDEKTLLWWVDSAEFESVLHTGYVGNGDSRPHAELIATLHRTIDAQLAILRGARSDINIYGGPGRGWHHSAVYLADAILGGSQ